MRYYPIILLPDEIQKIKTRYPAIPVLNISKPQLLVSKPKKVSIANISIQSAIISTPSVYLVHKKQEFFGFITLLIGMSLIALSAWKKYKNYPKRINHYHHQVKTYEDESEKYEQALIEHNKQVQKSQSPDNIARFQYQLILNFLKSSSLHDGNNSHAREGAMERIFMNKLNAKFSNKIHKGLFLNIPNYDFPYSPDFTYIDEQINLKVDIEIDEPYVGNTGQAIHFFGAIKDDRRNKFFNDKGWIVIRFSEEQIAKYPNSCCKVIAQVISSITLDNSILNQFQGVIDLPLQAQWSEEEAIEMANTQYRNSYLMNYR